MTGLTLIGSMEPVSAATGRDLNSEQGARSLADELRRWWLARGFDGAAFVAEPMVPPAPGKCPAVWGVHSNLLNGVPPRKADKRPPAIRRPAAAPKAAAAPRQTASREPLRGADRRVLEAIMAALAAGERPTMVTIGDRLGLARSYVAAVAGRLKERGYLVNRGFTTSSRWIVLRDPEGRPVRDNRRF